MPPGPPARRPRRGSKTTEVWSIQIDHYTLTIGLDVALLGLSFPNEQDVAFQALESFRPLQSAQMEEVRRRAATAIEGKEPCWWNPAA